MPAMAARMSHRRSWGSDVLQGDPAASEQLLPLVYAELCKLAAAKLAQEKPGQTLQATALVHEAYIRLVDQTMPQPWDSSRHFFAAAAEAMRRILIERARQKLGSRAGLLDCQTLPWYGSRRSSIVTPDVWRLADGGNNRVFPRVQLNRNPRGVFLWA
jgi:hypothetical protein